MSGASGNVILVRNMSGASGHVILVRNMSGASGIQSLPDHFSLLSGFMVAPIEKVSAFITSLKARGIVHLSGKATRQMSLQKFSLAPAYHGA
jgi:hypothetical protein